MNKYDRKRDPIKKSAKNEKKDAQKTEEHGFWKCEHCGEKISTTRDKCWKCQKYQSKLRTEPKPIKPIDRIYYHSDLYDDAFGMDVSEIVESIGADSELAHWQGKQLRDDYFNFEGNMLHQNLLPNQSDSTSTEYSIDAALERLGMLAVPCYVGLTWEREGRKEREAKIREARKKKREEELERSKVGKIKQTDVKQKKR